MLPLHFSLFDGVTHGVSTRLGGVSEAPYDTLNLGMSTGDREENVLTNRNLFAQALGVEQESVITARLVHGNKVSRFRSKQPEEWPIERVAVRQDSERTERAFRTDAVISDVPGLYFLLTFADCVPLLFADRNRGAVGAAHAGWRGTSLGIAGRVVEAMHTEFGSDPSDIIVGVGPSIGPCCYEVGPDVPATFESNGHEPALRRDGDRTVLDLWATNEQQLRAAGIGNEAIENPRLCTSCRPSEFFSHRGEKGRTGRLALCIGAGG